MTAVVTYHRREILDRFFAFTAEMERQRALVERPALAAPEAGRLGAAAADGSGGPGDIPAFLLEAPVAVIERADQAEAPAAALLDADPELLLERLQAYVETDARAFARQGTDLMIAQFREAQYAMVALADDVFLHEVEWDGRETWRGNHLEHRIFQSRLAGDRIFERMDALLASGDRRLDQLASVYLCILSLGFKGRHRGAGGEAELRSYADRLFRMIAGREPALFEEWSGRVLQPIVPSAYGHTVRGEASPSGRGLPRWWAVLAGIAALWIVIGHLLWLSSSSPVADAAATVLRLAGEGR